MGRGSTGRGKEAAEGTEQDVMERCMCEFEPADDAGPTKESKDQASETSRSRGGYVIEGRAKGQPGRSVQHFSLPHVLQLQALQRRSRRRASCVADASAAP